MLTAIPALITALSDRKKKTVAVGSTLLMLLCSREIFQQAIVWSAGFFNYIPPLVAAMLFAWSVKQTLDGKWKTGNYIGGACLLVLGIIAALYMENMTLFNIVLAVATTLFVWFVRKQVWPVCAGWLGGSLIGAVIMFSNSVYHSISQGEDSYRSFSGNLLQSIADSVGKVFTYGMYQNTVLNVLFTLLLICFVCRQTKNIGKGRIVSALTAYAVAWTMYATVYGLHTTMYTASISSSVTTIYTWQVLGSYTAAFNALSGLGYLVACFAILLLLAQDNRLKCRIWALYGSLGVMIAPLFIVTPIGPRNFFAGYIIQIMLACMMISELWQDKPLPKVAGASLMAALLVVCLYWTSIYAYIFKVDLQRKDYIAQQLAEGKQTIQVIQWPYEEYVWWAKTSEESPRFKKKKIAFRRFEGMPEDVKIEFITLAEYYAAHPDEIS